MSTRKYPRTTNEAFRHTAAYGCAIERPPEKRWQVLVGCVVLGVAYAALFYFGV